MKAILAMGLSGALVCLASSAELKIATVDLQRVVTDFHKAQETIKQFKEKEASFVKELEGMRLELQRLARQVEDLKEESTSTVLNSTERDRKKKDFEARLLDLNSFRLKYDDVHAQREAELQSQMTRSNQRIQDEVLSVTRRLGEQEGFNLILNANKSNPAAGDVLFSKNVDDLTDKVLSSLNGTNNPNRR